MGEPSVERLEWLFLSALVWVPIYLMIKGFLMNIAGLVNIALLCALVYLGWWLRGRYGAKAPALLRQDPFPQAVAASVPMVTDEEKIILEEYRKRKAEAEAREAEANRQAILQKAFSQNAPAP